MLLTSDTGPAASVSSNACAASVTATSAAGTPATRNASANKIDNILLFIYITPDLIIDSIVYAVSLEVYLP